MIKIDQKSRKYRGQNIKNSKCQKCLKLTEKQGNTGKKLFFPQNVKIPEIRKFTTNWHPWTLVEPKWNIPHANTIGFELTCGVKASKAETVREKPGLENKQLSCVCTSAMSSADGSLLSRNHWKKVRSRPCFRFWEFDTWTSSAFFTRSIPSFHCRGVDCDAGSPRKNNNGIIWLSEFQ